MLTFFFPPSQLPHRVCAIMRSEKSVLCLSRECDVSVVGENLQVQSHWKPTESQRLLKVFVYPKQKCSFAGAGSGQAGIVAVMFGHDVLKKVLRLYVLSITSKGETSVLDTEECPISDPEVCCKLLNRYHPSIKHYPYIACR